MRKGLDAFIDWLGLGAPPVDMNEKQARRYFRDYHPDGKLRYLTPIGRALDRVCEPADALVERFKRSSGR